MLSDTIIQQSRETPLNDIISRYVTLKRSGIEYIGLCPFHNEKTPSFSVHPTKGFYCHGCNAKGTNAVDFIMQIENLLFPDAVIRVASLAGLYIDDSQPVPVRTIQPKPAIKTKSVDMIPAEVVQANIKVYKTNHLYTFLVSRYGETIADDLAIKYGMASCNYYGKGTTLFIQQDEAGNIRHLKAILYDPATGKRRKEKEFDPKIIGRNEVARHTHRNYDEINLVQCYYGQHFLKGNNKPVALCESEKSAMLASLFYPQYDWMATGGKNGCKWYSSEVCKVLAGRPILLFPDADAVEDWRLHLDEIRKATGSKVMLIDLMDGKPAPEGKTKYDIADFLLDSERMPPRQANIETLNTDDIETIPSTTCTGKEFKDLLIVWVQTKAGNNYDVLFYPDGELVRQGEQPELVQQIARHYSKDFKSILFGNTPALVSIIHSPKFSN